MTTVLCAVDDSTHAAAVVYGAAGLAQFLKARLVVLRVDPHPRADGEVSEAEIALHGLVLRAVPGHLAYRESTDLVVKHGDPADVILAVAAERGAGLIVMGSRARGRIARSLLGSVAQRVMKDAQAPVLMVPPSDTEVVTIGDRGAVLHTGTILVPLALGSSADRQMGVATAFAAGARSRVKLLHVVPRGGDVRTASAAIDDVARRHSCVRSVKVETGDVVDAIAHAAAHARAGLVVLGRDRRAAGAVACEVIRRTNAVVAVVP